MLASLFAPLDNSHIFNIKILLQSFGNIIISNFQLRICYLLEIYSLMALNINILFFLLKFIYYSDNHDKASFGSICRSKRKKRKRKIYK
jgi:hypothetical protein